MDLYLINIKRACSGIHNRMRVRTPNSYTRDSDNFTRRSRLMKAKALTKYGDRKPEKKKLIKPRHLTQKHKFSSLDSIIMGSKVNNSGLVFKVYNFRNYGEPARKEEYSEKGNSEQEYLGSDVAKVSYEKFDKKYKKAV